MRNHFYLLLAAALVAGTAAAQSNRVPGPTDYESFSRFITDRNIFDPNRQAHNYGSTRPTVRHHVHTSAPSFAFVGALSYEKGLFAFFSGNQDEYKQILTAKQTTAGYTVTAVSLTNVTLVSADLKTTNDMAVGDLLRQDGEHWELVKVGSEPDVSWNSAPAAGGGTGTSADGSGKTEAEPAPTLTPATAPNDILKRLMEQRQKEQQ